MSTLSHRVNQGIVARGRQTTTIPIVMVYGIDPVGAGFIKSLAHPAEIITGDVRSFP